MKLRPEEISSVIKAQIAGYSAKLETADVGTVIQAADGIARIHGRENFWNFRERFTAWFRIWRRIMWAQCC